jgi:c-di-GMP-binding flagellar brake protein YcgR
MVLSAEVVELPRGAKLSARTADISRTGCYIDTLNPIPAGSQVRIRITHHDEVFEAVGRVVYLSQGLGMGIAFLAVEAEQQAKLERWLAESGAEF